MVIMYLLFVLIGSVEFNLWGQVISIWETGYEESRIEHRSRFLLVAPVFYVSELLNMPRDYLFSICIPLLLAASAYIMMQVVVSVTPSPLPSYWHFSLFYSVLVAISLFMNGRLVFAITGGSVLLSILSDMLEKKQQCKGFLTKQFIGFWLISVSSGTYLIGFAFFYSIFAYYLFQEKRQSIQLGSLIKSLVIFCILFIQSYFFLMKNLAFYGGGLEGLVNIFQHGAGAVLQETHGHYLLVFVAVAGAIATYLFTQFRNAAMLTYIILVVALGGLFGFSTLVIGIPALQVLSLIIVSRYFGRESCI